jgi:putative FmdB family regulatory protein
VVVTAPSYRRGRWYRSRAVPIYEYRCPNGHVFEVFKSMSDPAPEVCTTCGASPLQQVLYPVAIHYKGSGFYSTDYGRGARKAAGKDGGGEGAKAPSGGDDKPKEQKAAAAD